MFGFGKCTQKQKDHIDTLIDYFMFSLEGQAYVKEKLHEHNEKQGMKINPMSLNTEKIQEMAMGLLKESEIAKTKSSGFCEHYIFDQLKPALAVHEKSFESDRERYEEIFDEKFNAALVEKAKDNGWKAWK